MFSETIGNEYAVALTGTSEGTQIKYKKGVYWYKQDRNGEEGLVEYLVSRLLSFSDLPKDSYVVYEQGEINQRPGCRSKNFLKSNEEFITFYRLYYNDTGKDLSVICNQFDTMEERISYVIRYFSQSCGVDVTAYLRNIFTLDWLVLNEDRHFNNLGLIFGETGFRCAPIFDNGVSLLTANISINRNFSIEENVRRVTARPFCGSHKKMAQYFGIGFSLDFPSALQWLETEPTSWERDILMFQLRSSAAAAWMSDTPGASCRNIS